MNKEPFSENISDIGNFFQQTLKDMTWHKEQIKHLECMSQDFLHSLELDGLNYKERAKIATQLAKCRQERREHKKMVEILTPLHSFLISSMGGQLRSAFPNVLGETRKVENAVSKRYYIPRVIKKECEDQ